MENTTARIFSYITAAIAYITAFYGSYYAVYFTMQFITWLIMLAGGGLLASCLIWVLAFIPAVVFCASVFALSLIVVGAVAAGVLWLFDKCFGSKSDIHVEIEEMQPAYANAA